MKSYLSKLGVLLFGAMFAVAACQDYDEDIRLVESELTADINELSSKLDAAIADLEGKADKADLEAALEAIEEAEDAIGRLEAADTDLQNQINTALAEVQGHIETLYANDELLTNNLNDLAGKVTSNEAKIAAVETELAAVKAQVETLIGKVAANEEAIAALQQADKDLQAAIDAEEAAREQAIEAAKTALTAYVDAEIDKVEALIVAEREAREAAEAKLREDFAKADADLKAELKDLIDANEKRIDALEDAVEALQKLAEDLSADLTAAQEEIKAIQDKLATIIEDVNTAIARVQSLVYVPEYSDHKATLDWAKIVVPRGSMAYPTILAKASDLKYLVKAENAESVAAAIAANPEVLDYVVKGVQTRAAAADLEIVKVVAKGEYIIVSVVAKNFDNVFYTDSEEGCYSAALVLSDDKNTRTTEFTNLVASEEYAEFSMELFVPGEDDALRMATENEVINYLMVCNDYKTVKTAVKPVVGFVNVANPTDPATFYTVDYMTKELGYDVTVDTAITLVDTEKNNVHDGTLDTKPGPIGIDPYFNIEGGNPVYDFHYSVKPDVTFDNVGKKSTVNYTFTCGDVVNSLTYEFELANAQVAINAEVNIDWTVALQESLINNGVQYGNPLVFEVKEFESVGGAVTNLWSALSQIKKDTKSYEKKDGAWVESSKIISNKTLTETEAVYQLAAKKYEWNNSYKVVFVTTNDELNVDYTTTIIVNLVGKPAVIDVPAIDVDLLLNGQDSYFGADVDLFGASYAAIEKYLGYADAAANKAAWTTEFKNFVDQNTAPNLPVVNEKTGPATTLNELKQARLSISEHNNGTYKILVNEPNVITYTANSWFGVPFNFTVNASVVLPDADLIYSEDYVKNIAADPYAEAEAAIENGVYSIIKSDLAKYFNVAAESLEGHDYKVDFTVLSPEGNVVSLDSYSTKVVDEGKTYCFLESGAYLDWMDYTGLEVNVSATLLVNEFVLETLNLKVVAVDPLTLSVADFDVTRLHRDDTVVKVYDHVTITSTEEPGKTNILTIADGNDFAATVKYAKDTYGVDLKLVLDPQGIYYYDNSGEKVYVGSNKYKYVDGVLTVYGDDSVVKNYYAEFTAVMTSRICKGEHRESFRITIKK